MTFLARRDGMLSDKRETGQVMVKYNLVAPAILVVAALTLFAFLAFVFVVHTMAGITVRAEFFLEHIPLVTTPAFNILMFASQREI